MKKLVLIMCLFAFALGTKAQVTIWYGANIAKVGGDAKDASSELKFINFGTTYTAPINDKFDCSAGLSYMTKGAKDWSPSSLQVDVNALFNAYKTDNLKLSILAGPYIGYILKDDDLEMKKVDYGVSFGAQEIYKQFSLKIGYEIGLANVSDIEDYSIKINGLYLRIGYNF